MKELIRPVKAERFLCLPALIQTIILQLDIKDLSQLEIADALGVAIPPGLTSGGLQHTFSAHSSQEIGVHIDTEKINLLLSGHHIPLACLFYRCIDFEDWSFEEAIISGYELEQYLIFCFDHGQLYSTSDSIGFGHTALLVDLYRTGCEIILRVFDPGPEGYGEHEVDCWSMFRSMRAIAGGWLLFYHT